LGYYSGIHTKLLNARRREGELLSFFNPSVEVKVCKISGRPLLFEERKTLGGIKI
jgi:hypothetical protein